MLRVARHLAVFSFCLMNAFGQEIPIVKFNHLSFVLESNDLKAISESRFLSEEFIACETRKAEAESPSPRTTLYLYGPSCYLELFEAAGDEASPGVSVLAFSLDRMGELNVLKNIIDKTRKTLVVSRQRDVNGVKVAWFDALFIIDPRLENPSRFHFWVMEYKPEYFEHSHYTIINNELTRENYLRKYAPERKNKIVERLSGVTMKLKPTEKECLTEFFKLLKFKRPNENEFLLPDDFRFFLEDRPSGDLKTLASVEFETSKSIAKQETVRISDHVFLFREGHRARLIFK